MRQFKVGRVMLLASTMVLLSAGSAAPATQNASNAPSQACVLPCFQIYGSNLFVDAPTAADYCGISVAVLLATQMGQIIDCGGGKKIKRVPCPPPCDVFGRSSNHHGNAVARLSE